MPQRKIALGYRRHIVDVAVVVGTVLLLVYAWFVWRDPRPFVATDSVDFALRVGAHVPLPIDWRKSERTLILALSSECPACAASAAFYNRLFQACLPTGCRGVVLTIERQETMERWLRSIGVQFEIVVLSRNVRLGLHRTPTVGVVDGTGVLTELFVGRAPSFVESQLLARVSGAVDATTVNSEPPVRLTRIDAVSLADFDVVLDVRERNECGESSRSTQRRCVPMNEFAIRAPYELYDHHSYALDCSVIDADTCRRALRSLGTVLSKPVTVILGRTAD